MPGRMRCAAGKSKIDIFDCDSDSFFSVNLLPCADVQGSFIGLQTFNDNITLSI